MTVRARLHAGRGETAAAAARLEDAARLSGDDPDPDLAAYVALAGGEAALLAGLPGDAVEAARSGVRALEGSEDAGSEIPLLALAAEATAELAADDAARRDPGLARELAAGATDLAARAAELAGRSSTPSARAFAARAAAEATRASGTADVDRWSAAVRARDEAGLLAPAAAARLRYAEAVLLARGPREPAETAIRDGARRGDALGAAAVARPGARARAPRAGGDRGRARSSRRPCRPRRRQARSRPSRTASSRCSASSRSGAATGRSPRSCSSRARRRPAHVTHILDKLGVSNRLEAAMLASRLGLLPPEALPDDD